MYKIQIILDVKQDVIRTLIIDENHTLEKLHFDIAEAFGFDGKEMASFYISDNGWNQEEEIPLLNMEDTDCGLSMRTCILKEILPNQNDKLIYIYDFLYMWTFYVEVIEKSDETTPETKVILSVGKVPEEMPDKIFKSERTTDAFNSNIDDPFDSFENSDDFDNY